MSDQATVAQNFVYRPVLGFYKDFIRITMNGYELPRLPKTSYDCLGVPSQEDGGGGGEWKGGGGWNEGR